MAPEIRPAPFTRPEPAPAVRRPYLVFMRVGATDLLPDWLAAEPERNWDVFVSGYAPREPQPGAVATVIGGYNKLEHFRECVQSGALDLSAYRYVLLADDDLAVTAGSISAFFEDVERLGLTVAHPAQDWSGYWSHRIMLRNPLAEWRETNFVEIMCPCLDTGFIARRLNDLPITFSTWGSDHALCHLARQDGGKVGIIDTTVIRHTRPIKTDGAFYRKLAGDGIDPEAEFRSVLATLPEDCRHHRVLGHHPAPGLLAPLRGLAARLVEKHKSRILRFKGHHGRLEY